MFGRLFWSSRCLSVERGNRYNSLYNSLFSGSAEADCRAARATGGRTRSWKEAGQVTFVTVHTTVVTKLLIRVHTKVLTTFNHRAATATIQ